MIAKLMRTVKKVRPWMVAVAMATGAAWAASCDDSGSSCVPDELRCTTDEECVERNGPGSYCSTGTVLVPDGCGNMVDWGRVCVSSGDADAGAVATRTPAEAEDGRRGRRLRAGDVLRLTRSARTTRSAGGTARADRKLRDLPDTCGAVNWGPTCEPPGGADADADADPGDVTNYYGPPPVDAEDYSDVGTFYGPPPVDGDTDVGTWYGPPPPDASADADDEVPSTFYGPIPVDGGGAEADDDASPMLYGPMPSD